MFRRTSSQRVFPRGRVRYVDETEHPSALRSVLARECLTPELGDAQCLCPCSRNLVTSFDPIIHCRHHYDFHDCYSIFVYLCACRLSSERIRFLKVWQVSYRASASFDH